MEHPLWDKASGLVSSLFRGQDEKYSYRMVEGLNDDPWSPSSPSASAATEFPFSNNLTGLDRRRDSSWLARWELTNKFTKRTIVAGVAIFILLLASLLLGDSSGSLQLQSESALPPTRVGPRQYPSLYHGKGCDSTQLLDSFSKTRIAPSGPSRFKALVPGPTSLDLSNFTFSFELSGCPPPHIFTPAETCDLVSAFGGIFFQGDSLVRNFKTAIYMLLTNSLVVVRDREAECTGNDVFENRAVCRQHTYWNSTKISHVCPLEPYVFYDQMWTFFSTPDPEVPKAISERDTSSQALSAPGLPPAVGTKATHRVYDKFISELPESRQKASPVFLHATGIHYRFNSSIAKYSQIDAFLDLTADASPQPIKIWPSYTAAGPNKPKAWLALQGSDKVIKYNREIDQLLKATSPQQVSFGGWKQFEMYNITEGAYSKDGTHFGIQVNMEKAMILLNLLDTIWGEIVDAGGLLEE